MLICSSKVGRLPRGVWQAVRIMTFSDPRSHSEPLLKSLRLLKFSDIIHLEILSFVYQWYHELSPSCFVNIFNSFISNSRER